MKLYPAHLLLEGRGALVIGGGPVAAGKALSLADSGAEVRVVAAECSPEMSQVVQEHGLRLISREFRPEDLEDMWLVVAATDQPVVQRTVAKEANARGIFVCSVDDPSNCSFISPAVLRRGDLIFTVSTSGIAPALASRLRDILGEIFGEEYGPALAVLAELREELRRRYPDPAERRTEWYRLIDTEILPALRAGKSRAMMPDE